METANLRNFGKSFSELAINIPYKVQVILLTCSWKILYKNLGIKNALNIMISYNMHYKRMLKEKLPELKEKVVDDEKYIKVQIKYAALYPAIRETVGENMAVKIIHQIHAAVANPLFYSVSPLPSNIKKCKNQWAAYKEYFRSQVEASIQRKKYYMFDIIEDNDKAFQANCTFCAHSEIYKYLGLEKIDMCYTDDIFFPGYCGKFGVKFLRVNTIHRGGPHCDFRFEKI